MRGSIIATPLIVLLTFCTGYARTWHILPDSTGDAPTIQAGVDSSTAGDTVLVGCGTYYEHDINLKSGICLWSTTGEAECVIVDAQQQGQVLHCPSGGGLSIKGLTITGGLATGSSQGAGMYCLLSSPKLTRCSLVGNVTTDDYGGGIYSVLGSLTLIDCSFEGNTSNRDGGAIYAMDCSLTLAGCSLTGNSSNWDGGAIGADGCTLTLDSCTFSENSAYRMGGGVHFSGGSSSFAGCEFRGNFATEYEGGGMVLWDHFARVTECAFSLNRAPLQGGGVFCWGGSPEFTYCIFSGNSAGQYGGGVVSQASTAAPTLSNTTFAGNSAQYGGGICCRSRSSTSVDRTIIAYSDLGSGVYCDENSSAVLSCCDVYGNAGGDWVGCIADQYGSNGNFSACPSFCHADNGDLHLCDESPCLPGNHPDGYDCGLVGAWGEGCICGATQTLPTTWGAIKSMYK